MSFILVEALVALIVQLVLSALMSAYIGSRVRMLVDRCELMRINREIISFQQDNSEIISSIISLRTDMSRLHDEIQRSQSQVRHMINNVAQEALLRRALRERVH